MERFRRSTTVSILAFLGFGVAFAGCGGGGGVAPPVITVTQDAIVTGQYDLVLTSTNGRGTTNIYADFMQIGKEFSGAAGTLVCPSNDLSKCEGEAATGVSITPIGTVSGANVTIVLSLPGAGGGNTVTMVGTAEATSLGGTYTDSLGDSGNWTAFGAMHPFGPAPGVYDYSGTFNSTANPLLVAPTISVELGQQASPNLTGTATITNSPCIGSLNFSGQAVGDAITLTDSANKVSIIALPTQPINTSFSFNFSYKFGPDAANCAGDFGLGVVTIQKSPWDY
jgi:hypothetical protein